MKSVTFLRRSFMQNMWKEFRMQEDDDESDDEEEFDSEDDDSY